MQEIEFENSVVTLCNDFFLKKSHQHLDNDAKLMVSHFGEFSQDLVNSITTRVEETMLNTGEKKGIVKRMFSILVEGLQNIRIHGERDQDNQQLSHLIITSSEDGFRVGIANLIKNQNIPVVSERIERLNAMELPEVKALYMETLTNGIISQKGGAGLGFITMAMKSKNKLDFEFTHLDDELSFFSIDMRLDK